MDPSIAQFFDETKLLRPKELNETRQALDLWVKKQHQAGHRIAVVTSGGTTVPLEQKTVRFIDNFSSGTRGASCVEELIAGGYRVIFLNRKGSNFPFLTTFVAAAREKPLSLLEKDGLIHKAGTPPPELADALLSIPFETIFEYLFLLRECCQAVSIAGRASVILLAAAVSDFYIPEKEMVENKIQSRAHDGLNIQLRNVPKVLLSVKSWAPEAFLVSFKLETNLNILEAKAAGALKKYKVDLVCANQLQTIRDKVVLVWRSGEGDIRIAAEDIGGDETELVKVEGTTTQTINRSGSERIENNLVKALVERHDAHRGECSPKRRRVA